MGGDEAVFHRTILMRQMVLTKTIYLQKRVCDKFIGKEN